MLARYSKEIRRSEKVVRIFPGVGSAWRLVGALLAEKYEECLTIRRSLKVDGFYKWYHQQSESEEKDIHFEMIVLFD